MRPAEQESLLLRQIAALRRSGLPHDQALVHASDGLPPGALADRVSAARRALAAGEQQPDELLASGSVSIDAIEHAAQAIDATLSAEAALSMTRLYLAIGLVGVTVTASVMAWVLPDLGTITGVSTGPWALLIGLRSLLRYAGLPLAVGILLLIRRTGSMPAPGVSQIQQAANLLTIAAAGGNPISAMKHNNDLAYFTLRQQQVGDRQAAAEVAGELLREGENTAALFRTLAPVAAAVLAVVVLMPLLMLFVMPLFSMAGGL